MQTIDLWLQSLFSCPLLLFNELTARGVRAAGSWPLNGKLAVFDYTAKVQRISLVVKFSAFIRLLKLVNIFKALRGGV